MSDLSDVFPGTKKRTENSFGLKSQFIIITAYNMQLYYEDLN